MPPAPSRKNAWKRLSGVLALQLLYEPRGEKNRMNHGIYIAAAGMKSREQALEVASNNVANAGTAGFKKDLVFYNIYNRVQGSPLERALSDAVVAERTTTDFTAGPLMQTDNPLDLALGPEGFFAVETPQGVLYTRSGEFTLNAQQEIVTAQGNRVLGESGPIRVPEGVIAISTTGDVSVDGVSAGRLKVVTFADVNTLRKAGTTFFAAPAGATELPPAQLEVHQGYLERANVNPAEGLGNVIANMRSFEMLARAMRMLSQDIDRKVIDEVGRV